MNDTPSQAPQPGTESESDFPNRFDFAAAQSRIYARWEEERCFAANVDAPGEPYTIVIPPPNVTGALHLGHALNNTLQDIQIRMRRMQGCNTLWMPGTDHAGIATQAVVERGIREAEGLTRHNLGREELVRRIWQWKEQYETRILGQLKQMGCSCDWERVRFTLDDTCATAVRETFYDLFQQSKIFRGKRLVNWDTFLGTAVSDDEVESKKIDGHFWHFRYPVIDPKPGEPEHVVVATTRPETMLGDTAVAVHPDPSAALSKAESELKQKLKKASEKERPEVQEQIENVQQRRSSMLGSLEQLRDMALDGRMVMLPLMDRPIPLVADVWAKPDLGSGCVKITPAHDPNDYEVGRRCELPMISIFQPDGTLNADAGKYQGLAIADARKQVVADLDTLGLLGDVEDKVIEMPHSDRSKTPIEPMLADQWFVKMNELAQSAIDAVEDGRVSIYPERYRKSYLDWLGEKRDWPVSRQLWWGHRIPVWSKAIWNDEELTDLQTKLDGLQAEHADAMATQIEHPEVEYESKVELPMAFIHVCLRRDHAALESQLEALGLEQDPDVLDTWFSSALWPHSTLGWPESTAELAKYYPTSTLITSRDIITLWVARMVLMGLNNVGAIPFHEVFIHPKILDGDGDTMSKSKGNGIDPLDVIDKFGADPLRFAMAHLTTETQDVRMPVEFECPHCDKHIKQTQQNRILPKIKCPGCKGSFSTQWASTDEDCALPRGAVVSEKFEQARNFSNKLWNAARFACMNLDGYEPAPIDRAQLPLEDRWLLSRLNTVTEQVTNDLEHYRYADASRTLLGFAWDEFCSFYIEMAKARFSDPDQGPTAKRVLAHGLDTLLRLLHPIMPFITEEIWGRLNQMAPARGLSDPQPVAATIMRVAWPNVEPSLVSPEIEGQFAIFQQTLGSVRELRSQQNIPPKAQLDLQVRCDAETTGLLEAMAPYYTQLANTTPTQWGETVTPQPLCATGSLPGIELYLDIREYIDIDAEKARLKKQLGKVEGLASGIEKKLSNPNFVDRAPADVVAQNRESLAQLREQITALKKALADLEDAEE